MSPWLIRKVTYLTLLFAVVIFGLIRFKQLNRSSRLVLLLVSATFPFELTAIILAKNRFPNDWLYTLFSPVQLVVTLLIYHSLLDSKKWRSFCLVFSVITFTLLIADYFYFSKTVNNINITARSVCYVFLSLVFYQEWVQKNQPTAARNSGPFWFNSAVLFFYLINLLFWSVYNVKIQNDLVVNRIFTYILHYSNLLYYSLIWYSMALSIKSSSKNA